MTRARDEFVPMYLEPGGPLVFPEPDLADSRGLVAFGGDLRAERLLLAYSNGIFPWFDDEDPPLWWSPDPRCVLPLDSLHVPRRLERRLRRPDFELSWNRAFEDVMRCCAVDRDDGTWITEWMVDAYCGLRERGHAHSFEVWHGDELVGGLYGVQVGALFAAESMFHSRTDMSKVALVGCVRSLARAGVRLFDVQFRTEHLAQFGCVEVERREYLESVRRASVIPVELEHLVPGVG